MISVSGLVGADVYKWVDEQGNYVFSDQPRPGAEKVDLPEPMTYTPAPVKSKPAGTGKVESGVRYTRLEVAEPQPDATVRDNEGRVPVSVSLEPTLDTAAGHRIAITIDGVAQENRSDSPNFSLVNLERGTHTLQVSVVDGNGTTLIESEPVTFHLHRHSALFPKPSPSPAP